LILYRATKGGPVTLKDTGTMSKEEAFEQADILFKTKGKSTGSGWLIDGRKKLIQYWYSGDHDRSYLTNLGEWMGTKCEGFTTVHPDDASLGFAPKYKK